MEFKQYDPGEPTGTCMSIHPDSVAGVECLIDNDQACKITLKSGGEYTVVGNRAEVEARLWPKLA